MRRSRKYNATGTWPLFTSVIGPSLTAHKKNAGDLRYHASERWNEAYSIMMIVIALRFSRLYFQTFDIIQESLKKMDFH